MITPKQRENLIAKMAMFFAENGSIVSAAEFNKLKNRPKHVTAGLVRNSFGSWKTMLNMVQRKHPDLWSLATNTPSAVDDAAEVMSKSDPLEALRASSVEK